MKKMFEFRPSTLIERKEFYEKEFDISKARDWFKKTGRKLPQVCALDAGSDSGIIANKKWKGKMFYFPFNELKEKLQKYAPEDVYYDRNLYRNPKEVLKRLEFKDAISQELAFDIDVDNLADADPKNKKEYEKAIRKAYLYAIKLKKEILKTFRKADVTYSGRGFHVKVPDKKASRLNFRERAELAKKFSKYPIDPWVTRGYIRLIRLPYSLNGLVSRIVVPLGKTRAFNQKEAIPGFLKQKIKL